jgi:hypothetical protein
MKGFAQVGVLFLSTREIIYPSKFVTIRGKKVEHMTSNKSGISGN